MSKVYPFAGAFLLALLTISGLFAQNGRISGTVRTSDGQAAAFVTIQLKGTGKGTIVDTSGAFTIEAVKAGGYSIQASFVGLTTQSQKIEVRDGQTTNVQFTLEENSKGLKEVVIMANPSQYVTDYPSVSLRLKNTPARTAPKHSGGDQTGPR